MEPVSVCSAVKRLVCGVQCVFKENGENGEEASTCENRCRICIQNSLR